MNELKMERPELEVIRFNTADIIATSGTQTTPGDTQPDPTVGW